MSVEKKFYGYTADQKEISSYTLTNKSGMKAVLLDIGAVIESLLVPDKNGNLVDVVLGFGDPKLYLENNGSLGAVVGRHANRIANATYTLNGVTYSLRLIMVLTIFTATREATISVCGMQRLEKTQLPLHFIVQMVIRIIRVTLQLQLPIR